MFIICVCVDMFKNVNEVCTAEVNFYTSTLIPFMQKAAFSGILMHFLKFLVSKQRFQNNKCPLIKTKTVVNTVQIKSSLAYFVIYHM